MKLKTGLLALAICVGTVAMAADRVGQWLSVLPSDDPTCNSQYLI